MKNQTINPAQYTAHKSPGKFEGESPATEYFYEQMLCGVDEIITNDCDEVASLFQIETEEAEAFHLPAESYFLLWTDSNGFVYGEVYRTHSFAVRAFNSKI